MTHITPHLWFDDNAEEATAFYVSLFPNSRIARTTNSHTKTPGGPAGSVQIIEFTLADQPFLALNGGPKDVFNHAISFIHYCADQAEIDRLWHGLAEGGSTEMCGWVKDRFGLSWQIVPKVLAEMLADPDRDRAKRAMDAMMAMDKINIAGLVAAYDVK